MNQPAKLPTSAVGSSPGARAALAGYLRRHGPAWMTLVWFAAVGLFSGRLLLLRWFPTDADGQRLTSIPVAPQDMPDHLGQWQVRGFEHLMRHDAFAPESWAWRVQHDDRQAVVSIDGPYAEYHTLNLCYAGLGWSTATQFDYATTGDWQPGQLNATLIDMRRGDTSGLVMFTAVDRWGNLVPAARGMLPTRWEAILANIRRVCGSRQQPFRSSSHDELPIYQLQVYYESQDAIAEDERAAVVELFQQARAEFLSWERFRPAAGSERQSS